VPKRTDHGYIYMYWFEGNFGYVKIGYTNNLDARKKAWVKKCGHNLTYVYPKKEGQSMIPHAKRTERLIHAELKDVRFRETACPCGRRHREWFEVSHNFATKVVEKWTTWMSQANYEQVPGGERDEWRLKKTVTEQEIQRMCEPIVPPAPYTSPRPRKTAPMGEQSIGVWATALGINSRRS
jgi:hypothetical protein